MLEIELLQVAVGNRDKLSKTPTADEWDRLFKFTQEQAIAGMMFKSLERLPKEQKPDATKIGQWYLFIQHIVEDNQKVNRQCRILNKHLVKDGLEGCVLKGQSAADLYKIKEGDEVTDLSLYRSSGDIDMWVLPLEGESEKDHVKRTLSWAKSTDHMFYQDYHHADLNVFRETEVELHYRATLSRNIPRNSRIQKWLNKEGRKHVVFRPDLRFAVPDFVFATMLTLNHNFFHLLYEGVGFRQCMDLYFILTNYDGDEKKKAEVKRLIKDWKLEKFAGASMWLMKECFGMDERYMIAEPDARRGQHLLDEIMKAGNFGKYDKRLDENRYDSRLRLMAVWICHSMRLFNDYPTDVLWTPFGILRISLGKY